jgi:hypothetical protein
MRAVILLIYLAVAGAFIAPALAGLLHAVNGAHSAPSTDCFTDACICERILD